MAETIIGLIAEAKRNRYSLIPALSEDGKQVPHSREIVCLFKH